MTGFIAHIPPAAIPAHTISSGPFWPDVDTAYVRGVGRFDGTVTDQLLSAAIIGAITHVNDQLDAWSSQQQAIGHAHLWDVPANHINGKSTRVHAWQRAIAHAAMAQIEDTRRAKSTLPGGLGKDDRVLESVGLRTADHWQTVRHAIADVMGHARETIELI